MLPGRLHAPGDAEVRRQILEIGRPGVDRRHDMTCALLRDPRGFRRFAAGRAGDPAAGADVAASAGYVSGFRAPDDGGGAYAWVGRAVRHRVRLRGRPDGSEMRGGGSTHAWCQVYLPGAGWVEFDPTNGIVGNRDLIRVAVGRDPRQAIPLRGSFRGSATDYAGNVGAGKCDHRARLRPFRRVGVGNPAIP